MHSHANDTARKTVIAGLISGIVIGLYGLFVSRSHITEVAHWANIGAGWECETAFLVVDTLVLYGKVLTLKSLSAKTRRTGHKLMIGGGLVSVACNIGAGLIRHSLGGAIWGVFVVAVIAAIEYAISVTKAKAATARRTERKTPVKPAGRVCPPRCTCGKHKPRTQTRQVALVP